MYFGYSWRCSTSQPAGASARGRGMVARVDEEFAGPSVRPAGLRFKPESNQPVHGLRKRFDMGWLHGLVRLKPDHVQGGFCSSVEPPVSWTLGI